jgi:hypothetical protein
METRRGPTIGTFLLRAGGENSLSEHYEQLLAGKGASALRRIPWGPLNKEIGAKVAELLDIEISEVIESAWAKGDELLRYANPEEYPPDETIITELAEHTIETDYHPSLEIMVNEQKLPEIQLDVFLSLTIKGLILKIQGGKIRELGTGSIDGKGRLEVAGTVILQRESGPIQLPGSRALDTGYTDGQPPSNSA